MLRFRKEELLQLLTSSSLVDTEQNLTGLGMCLVGEALSGTRKSAPGLNSLPLDRDRGALPWK